MNAPVDWAVARAVRDARIWYPLLMVFSVLGIFMPEFRFYVPGDAAATAAKIIASETLYRLAIASFLAGQACQIFVMLSLYRLFRRVDEEQARTLFALVVVMVPMAFLASLNNLAPLVLLGGGPSRGFDPAQVQSLAMLFIELQRLAALLTGVFWGLWLIPLGRLVWASGFFPRVLAVLLFIAGAAYLADSFTGLVLPSMRPSVSPVTTVLVMCELPFVLWLLIRGARRRGTPPHAV